MRRWNSFVKSLYEKHNTGFLPTRILFGELKEEGLSEREAMSVINSLDFGGIIFFVWGLFGSGAKAEPGYVLMTEELKKSLRRERMWLDKRMVYEATLRELYEEHNRIANQVARYEEAHMLLLIEAITRMLRGKRTVYEGDVVRLLVKEGHVEREVYDAIGRGEEGGYLKVDFDSEERPYLYLPHGADNKLRKDMERYIDECGRIREVALTKTVVKMLSEKGELAYSELVDLAKKRGLTDSEVEFAIKKARGLGFIGLRRSKRRETFESCFFLARELDKVKWTSKNLY